MRVERAQAERSDTARERSRRERPQARATRQRESDAQSRTNMRPADDRTERGARASAAPRDERRGRSARRDDDRPRATDRSRAEIRNQRDRDHRGRSGDYRRDDRPRNDSRYRGGRHSSHQPYYARGKVSRVLRHGSGYRVWVVGAPYPFFVPHTHYHRDRFRPGIVISLGGLYNPRGYYDYYDERSSGAMRGVVESVDYRRESFVVRNDATGSFVTVALRRGRLDVRPGDYVQLYGDWNRYGVFNAYELDYLDYR